MLRCAPGVADACRPGYSCQKTTDGEAAFCVPAAPKKAAIGSACTTNSACSSNVCTAWPGGYCSKGCATSAECGGSNVCVIGAINGVDACLSRCENPGTRSSCREGYRCSGLRGLSYGACMAIEEPSGEGGGSGAGGGSGGGVGAGGGSGGASGGSAGGGSASSRCRTYATSYTEVIMGYLARSVTHSVAFDRTSRTLTDVSSDGTVVQAFATVADFIEHADPAAFMQRGLPTQVRTTANGATTERTHSFDAQGRMTGMVERLTAGATSHEALRGTTTQWDAQGRATHATQDVKTSVPSERCVGQALRNDYDDANRSMITYVSGGTNHTTTNTSHCRPYRYTVTFDQNTNLKSRMFEQAFTMSTWWSQVMIHTTSTVCL